DRSVAVELQQQAKKYLEGLLSFVESADATEAAKVKSSEKREDPEMVAIEDTEIPKLGSRGEELLRQVYAMEGWKSLGSSSSQEDMDVFTKTVRNAHVTPSGSHVSSAASNESGIASLLVAFVEGGGSILKFTANARAIKAEMRTVWQRWLKRFTKAKPKAEAARAKVAA
ncbi:unnamed protein product, partial [Symbiodinium natans]